MSPYPGPVPIRPRVIFGKIEDTFPEENVWMSMMVPPTRIGSITLLEGSILLSLCRLAGVKEVFEFGTYLGGTTVTLAANLPEGKVTSLDIDESATHVLGSGSKVMAASSENDDFLRKVHLGEEPIYIRRAPAAVQARIRLLKGDSRQLDVEGLGLTSSFDLIFVDGGHDAETIAADTTNALKMLRPGGIIAWHDYGSPVHGEVTAYVDSLAKKLRIFVVEASSIAFTWPGFDQP